jgi:succinate dehydrogenase / fumarate reductase cytochrome b subunit
MAALGSFGNSSIGKKFVVAVTGLGMVGFLLGHLLGNLLVFEGAEAVNQYAAILRFDPFILWGLRLGLIAMVTLHIFFTVRLTLENRAARPVGYASLGTEKASVASRTMIYGGILVLLYIVYHLLHLTFRAVHPGLVPNDHHNVYANIVGSFQEPIVAAVYIAAQVVLFFHLKHGFQSAFRTIGVSHPGRLQALEKLSVIIALVITAGFISIPVAILTGFVN